VGRADKKDGKEKQTMITLSGRAIEKLKESNLESRKETLRVFISGMG
jgi:Fe-S cluster assembly iron-binding protein IscA